jgi:hypothetical protein
MPPQLHVRLPGFFGLTQKFLDANQFLSFYIEFFHFAPGNWIRATLTGRCPPLTEGFMTETSEIRQRSAERRMFLARQIAGAIFMMAVLPAPAQTPPAAAQTATQANSAGIPHCRVEDVDYRGWKAQQLSNRWVQLVIVPQNGGRLMQVTLGGHAYLFVNPKLAGKYMPPSQDQWFNYGGDKLWLLPEGEADEQHWRGNSDLLDDGQFSFRKLSDEEGCGIELTGPPDPHTGIQFSRIIRLDPDSPHIAFRASMRNVSGHPVEWSMQSVSQYDTASAAEPLRINHEFWGFTPANHSSGYLNRYHVRFGPAENPGAAVRDDGLFSVHYAHLAAELWVDSADGWLAVVDGSSLYAMVERFQYQERKPYPGKASVIFWTNGPQLRWSGDAEASLTDGSARESPFYMEAEINSPMCRLRPGEACQLETDWFPTRAGGEFHGVTDAGIISRPLQAARLGNGKVKLSGSFGVFFAGMLVAHFYNEHGSKIATVPLGTVSPTDLVALDMETVPQGKPTRVSLHLVEGGLDRGALQEVPIRAGENPLK